MRTGSCVLPVLLLMGAVAAGATGSQPERLRDPRLSADGQRACTTCHQPARGFAGATAPSLLDLAERASVGSDALPLEAFVAHALRTELGATPALVAQRLGVPWEAVVSDLTDEIRALQSATPAPLSPAAQRGARVFVAAGCATCHAGPSLGGEGVVAGGPTRAAPQRVPALHTAGLSAPYFADGSAPTLADVLEVYVGGGRAGAGQSLAPLLLPPAEQAALETFLVEQRATP